ncbi:(2E,6E)-farnesyl diphosphate synthase [Moritella sp.]|uniref:(2E,6E)-farnesyl diphosphate synthase n=1 Tax=Moritella sp. TaxID=78556 RepID=UPI001DECFF82|nr:(2E,6E)-farnesyl diphosphate synthase [Moritella sp.]MCJ8348003.1 (2E,6E)-farnesyl diphosphate synthase [Moritella sp.]NQZ40324.1 (2E,6E)-farnesyl diphosphate synthase [Moritella sp.]
MQLSNSMALYQGRINDYLQQQINLLPTHDTQLAAAMEYGLLQGGKRVRPVIVYAIGAMLGVDLADLDGPAAAIESIHAYSLIHDDLPAMDDDDLRRGQPTCHIKFDHATAILAGDALQPFAFEILLDCTLAPEAEKNRLAMLKSLTQASGYSGMCGGQAMDLAATDKQISLTQLEAIHNNKTGALINCAARLGCLASPLCSVELLASLDKWSNAIGLAFQVQDDILDIISDTETLGKPQGSDVELNKSTYPALLGLAGAQEKAQALYQQAIFALETIPHDTTVLALFTQYIIERNK